MSRLLLLFGSVWGVAVASSSSAQTTILVPQDFGSVGLAIGAAVDGDTVRVAPGAYLETIDFQGKAITVASVDGPAVTTINAGGLGSVVTFVSGEGASSRLEGFTLTGGDASSGGGIRCLGSSPTIVDCWLIGKQATYGGHLAADDSSGTIVLHSCRLEQGFASSMGGGIFAQGADLEIRDTEFIGNTAGGPGGGLVARACWCGPVRRVGRVGCGVWQTPCTAHQKAVAAPASRSGREASRNRPGGMLRERRSSRSRSCRRDRRRASWP